MQLVQLVGIALVCAIVAGVLKVVKPELSFAVILVGILLVVNYAVQNFLPLVSVFQEITSVTGIDGNIVTILLKIIGIGYLIEFSCELITDFGAPSLASKIEICGKIIIFSLSVPIIQSLLQVIQSLLQLV